MAIKFLNDVAVDSSVLYVDTANNRVGINDSTPTATLDITGTISSTGSITTNGSIRIDSTSTPTLILDTGGYYPGATIEVRKNNSSSPSMGGLYWYQNPGTQSSQWVTRLDSSPYTSSTITLPTISSYHFTINLQGTERFRINSSTGNVGIGTSSPDYTLDVAGNAGIDEYLYHNGDSDTYLRFLDNNVYLTAGSQGGLQCSSTLTTLQSLHGFYPDGNFAIGDTAGVFSGMSLKMNSSGSNITFESSAGYKAIYSDISTTYFQTNVGVGVTSPASKLQVNGAVQVADDTATASASKVGALRYRTSGNNSYVDMCMQTGASTYAWVNIVQNSW